jgi:fucose permease
VNQSRHALIALSFAILTAGFLASEVAVVLPLLLESLSLTAGQGGWVISVRFLGGTLASIILLVLGSRVSFRAIILSSSLVVFLTALLLPFIRAYGPVLIYSFVRGVALTLLIASTNAALSSWFWKNAGRWSAYVHAWFGVGLIAAPIAGFAVVAIGLPWQIVWALAGLLSVVVSILAFSLPRSRTPRGATPETQSGGRGSARIPVTLWLLPLAIAVVNVGTEGSIIGWVPSYVVLTGGSGTAGQTSSLLLAAGIILGRASVSRLSRRIEPSLLYRGSLLAVAMSALLMLLVPAVRPFAAPLLGLGMSAMYPTMVALFGRRARLTEGRLYAGTELAATLGGTALPALVGTLSESAPALAFPSVLIGGVAVLLVLSTLFRFQER